MSYPPKGYYRNIIGDKYPSIRIAFSHTPIHGCSKIEHTAVLISMLDSSDDPHAKFYADGLRSGELVAIVVGDYAHGIYKRNGELFFTT
jgi:hypothetical protein